MQLRDPFRTAAGEPFHASDKSGAGALLEADSSAFARVWNEGWKQEADLNGRVVIGLRVADRAAVDRLYGEITAAGHKGCSRRRRILGRTLCHRGGSDGLAVGLMSPLPTTLHQAAGRLDDLAP